MKIQERSAQARRALDRKFSQLDLHALRARPRSGWIRAIRDALGMSQSALGSRLGISGPAVAKLERAESHGGITLAKLDEVARSLDCTLVYALVPNSTLQATVEHQARRVARNQLEYVEATMGLESQALGSEQQAEYLDRYTQELVGRHDLWRTEPVLALNSGADDDT